MRKFYVLTPDFRISTYTDYDFVNEDQVTPSPIGNPNGGRFGSHEFGLGINPYSATPRLEFNPRKKKFCDIYPGLETVFYSDRMKALLEGIDPNAFEWLKIEAGQGQGEPPLAPYWIGDVIRVLECVDEAKSDIEYHKVDWDPNYHGYKTLKHLIMKPDLSPEHHIFRLRFTFRDIIVDDVIRDAIVKSKYKGCDFKEVGEG